MNNTICIFTIILSLTLLTIFIYGLYISFIGLFPKRVKVIENSPERQAFLDDFDNKRGLINREINEAYELMHIEFQKKCDAIYEKYGFVVSNRIGNCYTVSKKVEK